MAGFGDNDKIAIDVELVTEIAERAGDALKESLVAGFKAATKEAGKTDDQVEKLGKTTQRTGTQGKKAGEEMADGFKKAERSATEANSKLELLQKGYKGLNTVVGQVTKFIERGSAFDDLASTLDTLSKRAGTTAEAFSSQLNSALEGTIKNADLFRIANESLFAGLKPEQIVTAAEAARSFGDQLGGSTLKNFEAFTDSMIRGNDVALKRLGIIVDNKSAEREYFQQMGASAAQAEKLRKVLTEGEKADISRAASVDALNQKLAETEKPALDAADRLDQIRAKGSNAFDEIARGVVTNDKFQESLGNLAVAIDQANVGKLGEGFAIIVDAATDAITAVDRFIENYRSKLGAELQKTAAAKPVNDQLLEVTDLLNRGAGGDTASTVAAGKRINDITAKATKFGANADLAGQYAVGAFSGDIGKLQAQYEALAKSQGVYGQAALVAGEHQRVLNVATADGKSSAEKLTKTTAAQTTTTKTSTKALDEYLKRLKDLGKSGKASKDDLQKFTDEARKLTGLDVSATFVEKLHKAFVDNAGQPEKLTAALASIGREAKDAGQDLDALARKRDQIAKVQEQYPNAFKLGHPEEVDVSKITEDAAKQLQKEKGTIFGIDAGFSKELSEQLEGSLQDAFSLVQKALTSGITSDDAAAIGSTIGTVIGAAIGSYFGPAGTIAGSAIGSAAGGIIGQFASVFGSDGAGTKARKAADKFFADMFDADRLSVIVDGQVERIQDLVFNSGKLGTKLDNHIKGVAQAQGDVLGGALAGATATPAGKLIGSNAPSFNAEDNAAALQQQTAQVQSAFQAVGVGFEELLGVANDISGQIGAVLFNNVGGSLENLQILIQTSGKSFEELGNAIFDSFFNGNIGLLELQGQLAALQDLYLPGIPGEIGAVTEAAQNLQVALADGKGSRILFDSLRDVGAEAQEIGHNDLPFVAQSIAAALGLGANQVAQLLEAMKLAGINSIQELVDAGNNKLAALATNIQQITQGQAPTNTAITDPTAGYTPPTNFNDGKYSAPSGGGGSGASRGKSEAEKAAEKAKKELEQLRAQVIKNLQSTQEYQDVIEKLNSGLITSKEATKEIRGQYKDLFDATKRLQAAQEELEKALANPKSKKNLGELAKTVEELQKKVDKLTDKAEDRQVFDLGQIVPVIKTLNELGVVSRAVGVDLQNNVNILVEGFLKGKLSISEANEEIKKTKEILGEGIPNAVGAVGEAFSNLQNAGRKGGLFSADAFRDIFAEEEELFKKQGGPERQKQLKELTDQFDKARDALQNGIASGAAVDQIQKLSDAFESAKKRLSDFNSSENKADFADLRSELEKAFPKDQVDKFFQALDESGVTTFDEFKDASDEVVTGILGRLDELGFAFTDQVAPSVQAAIDKLVEQEKAAQDGKDVLAAEVDIVKGFNAAVEKLPATFRETADTIFAIQDPLKGLDSTFGTILDKLTKITGNKSGTITYDVSFRASDSKSQKLFDVVFGDGSDVIGGTGGSGPGLTAAEKKKLDRLTAKRKSGRLTKQERDDFEDLRKRAKG